MPATDLTHVNAALTRTGNPVIAALTDVAIGAQIAAQNYETLVKAELSNHPWKRATKIDVLDRIDPVVLGDPPEPWTAAYQLPNDLVDIRTVRVAGMTIPYEVHGDKMLCNAGVSDEVVMHYVWRVPENKWPPWFAEGITRRLEAIFLRAIGERYREAELRDKAAAEQFDLARNRDSQQQTSRNRVISSTLAARIGMLPGWMSSSRWPPW